MTIGRKTVRKGDTGDIGEHKEQRVMKNKETDGRSPQEVWELLFQSPHFKDEELQSRKTKWFNSNSFNMLMTKPGSAFGFSDSLFNVLNSVSSLYHMW